MKGNKKIILIISLFILVIAVNYFVEPTENESVIPDGSTNITSLEKENDKLKKQLASLRESLFETGKEIELLRESLFEAKKFIFDSKLANDYLPFPETEILYKEIEETKNVILYTDVVGNHLTVTSKEPSFATHFIIPSLNPMNGITWDYIRDSGLKFFGGVITNNEIKKVRVLHNEKVHKARIFQVDENLYGWYSIFVNEKKSGLDGADKIKIEALGEEGVILWEKSI